MVATSGTHPAPGTSRTIGLFVGAIALLVSLLVISLLCGASFYSPATILEDASVRSIVIDLRLPRTLCAVLVGGGLSVVGASYQAIFRNYLASPFTLGVSSGAALAASVALLIGATSSGLGIDVSLWAILGAMVSIVVISVISNQRRRASSSTLLLAGIVFSFFCSSLLTLIQYVADYSQLFRVTRWMMGGIPSLSWDDLLVGGVVVGVMSAWLLRHHRSFDLILFGDDLASVKGVDVQRIVRSAFVLTSFVVGWIVAQCGVIGFVGIIVPVICRMLVGQRHKLLLPMTCICGASLVVACDVAGRLIIPPFEIPAGVFTAVLGGPVFLVLLVRARNVLL